MTIEIEESEYNTLKEKAAKWDALEKEYFDETAVDEETGEDLNPDTDLCTLGELLEKHLGIHG